MKIGKRFFILYFILLVFFILLGLIYTISSLSLHNQNLKMSADLKILKEINNKLNLEILNSKKYENLEKIASEGLDMHAVKYIHYIKIPEKKLSKN
jgi:hypothetical protein